MKILITGGGRGLGKIIAENLLGDNNKVVIFDRLTKEQIDSSYLYKLDGYYKVDLGDFEILNNTLDEVLTKYGSFDVLINNAALREFFPFENFSQENITYNIKVNFEAPLFVIKKLLPSMIENNFGRIINVSSISGLQGYAKGTLYCSTKSALIIFTESLSSDLKLLKRNITANAILPDSFQTREGEKLKNYDFIINTAVKIIRELINTNINGKIVVISPPIKKIKEITKALFAQFKRFY